jgi:hypothetical protein
MLTRFLAATVAGLLAFAAVNRAAVGGAVVQTPAAPRIVAIGDIHGSAAGLQQILRAAGLIDDRQHWSGGTARLVQTGDFTDRGDKVRDVMDLLMRLEGEARRAGGRVDVLFGNHEGMNVLHDLRDVSSGAFAAFADARSEDRRRRAFEAHAEVAKRAGNTLVREEWMATHPPGFVEYVQAFGPRGNYGRWIRGRRAILQIDDTIFMHAGLHPQGTATVDETNRLVEREVKTWDELRATMESARLITNTYTLQEIIDVAQVEIGRIAIAQKTGEQLAEHVTRDYVERLIQLQTFSKWALIDENGPLWYRGYAASGDDVPPGFDALLTRLGVRRFVTGHTPQLPGGQITSRWGGKVFLIDTGMLASHYKGGQPSALEIHQGRVTAIYANRREPLDGTR